jgi:hypothetical protein
MNNDLEARLHAAYRARADSAPGDLHLDLPAQDEERPIVKPRRASRWTAPLAAMVAVLAIVASVVAIRQLLIESDELSPASSGITLNTSSWRPYDDDGSLWMQAAISGTVRVDAEGCVYLEGNRPDVVRNVLWPTGYTAAREADGAVTISNPDGDVVAATGHHIFVGGGAPPNMPKVDCRAHGTSEPTMMITDVLQPLNEYQGS